MLAQQASKPTTRRDFMKKKILTLGTLLLGCCLAAAAQSQNPTNPEFNQSGEAAANPPAAGNSISGTDWIRGCLSQSSDGSFMLADNSGNSFQLSGDTSKLSSYIGKQIQVHGTNSETTADAMSSDAAVGGAKQFTVKQVQKLSDTCK
jgi:hypothetical protein